MAAKILSISLPQHLIEFLQENEGLSASKVMQGALMNIQDSLKSNPQLMEANKQVMKLEKVTEKLQFELRNANGFIEFKILWKEFEEWMKK